MRAAHPGDSNDGQHVPLGEGEVLFVGGLEVVLGYALGASRPRRLNTRDTRVETF